MSIWSDVLRGRVGGGSTRAAGVGLAGLLVWLGCGSPIAVKPGQPQRITQQPVENLQDVDSLSPQTQQLLRVYSLDNKLPDYPTAVVAVLRGLRRSQLAHEALAAEAEVELMAAQNTPTRLPNDAANWYMLAAARAYEFMFGGRYTPIERAVDPLFQRMRRVYNVAVGSYVGLLGETAGGFHSHEQATRFGLFQVDIRVGTDRINPRLAESLLVAHELEIRGLRNRYRRDGIGAALVGYRPNLQEAPSDRFYSPEGFVEPVTAVLEFGPRVAGLVGQARSVFLSFYDPREKESIDIEGLDVPLQADFTTHHAYLVSLADTHALGRRGLLSPERFEDLTGLTLLELYDPQKIPIVMVHGLRSSSLAWMELSNDILGDPKLRNHYQIWQFFYPTALPYLYVGQVLRQELEAIRVELDPEGDDPAMQSMILVAHSMGGLVSRTLVCDSGDRLWDAAFTVGPDEIRGQPSDVEFLRKNFEFSHAEFVDRVIFVSTPHRGAERAAGIVGQLSASLVAVPDSLREPAERLWAQNRDLMTPEMRRLTKRGPPDSIEALRPNNVILQALGALPIAPEIPYHTIMGNRGRDDVTPLSDGWVTYDSVHLDGAQSEVIVPAGHAAYVHPGAIAEIKRILRQHLRESAELPMGQTVGTRRPATHLAPQEDVHAALGEPPVASPKRPL